MIRPRAFIVLTLVVFTAGVAAQQKPVRDDQASKWSGTASIAGVVVNDVTGAPVRRATVAIWGSDSPVRLSTATDDAGRFRFTDLAEGRYSASVSKRGYVTMNYGATRALRAGTTFLIAAGERKSDLTLRLPPGAVITGSVRNPAGDPVAGARVSVLRMAFLLDGGKALGPAGSFGLGELTDDRGEFRAYGLPAGEYWVVVTNGIGIRSSTELRETTAAEVDWATRELQSPGASPRPEAGRSVEYAPVFYPGVPNQAAAATITLRAGEERRGVDVLLDLVPTAKITGTVRSNDGPLPSNLTVAVIAHDTIPGIPFSGFGTARVDAAGKFESTGLPPGDYTVTVRAAQGRGAAAGSTAALFGIGVVSVNGVDIDTTITMGSGASVSGTIAFDAHTLKPPTSLANARISLTPDRGRAPTLGVMPATPDATGKFTFVGVTPGRYRMSASGLGGWFLRTATVGGGDAKDSSIEIGTADVAGMEITFTDLQQEINGDLLDASGQPAPEFFIILFPENKARWNSQTGRIMSTRPGGDGRFKFQNPPPGDYLIAAVTDVEQGEWNDPAFLQQLVSASTKISLAEGEKKTQSLRIKR
jgi:hypothetical protein